MIVCLVLSLLVLAGAWLIPAHLRAVDTGVVAAAGRKTPTLVEDGLNFVGAENLGAAQLLLRAGEMEHVPNRSKLAVDVNLALARHPVWLPLGAASPRLESVFGTVSYPSNATSVPFTDFIIKLGNLDRGLEFLSAGSDPAVKELLRCRSLTNTAIFPPSQSSSGQAFDAALTVCGLLLEEGCMSRGMSNAVATLSGSALSGGGSQQLEQMLLDYMSLGERFDWNQLAQFTSRIEDPETLRLLANFIRQAGGREPVIFSAVVLSGRPAAVATYLGNFSQTGLDDLGRSLGAGAGGLRELLRRNQRVADSPVRGRLDRYEPFAAYIDFATDYGWRRPEFTLIVKWVLYLAAGFLLAVGLHLAWPTATALEAPLQVRGVNLVRELIFALGFLLVVLVLSEPFLAQNSQKVAFPFRLSVPGMGGAVPAGEPGVKTTFMNTGNLLVMLLFFVLQFLLYSACLVKLAEIRRQHVPARMKLKLLENEDHLFDSGLYLGFLGTIVSFILFSLNVVHSFNLMAAFSSTSFGIVFVVVFKIFNLRPTRRQLLMEAEIESGGNLTPEAAAAMAPMS